MREIIEQFIEQIEDDQKFSLNTKSAYKSDLNDLIDYVISTKSEIADLNQSWVKNYLQHLESTNKERNSYNRRASTFRIFLRYLYNKNLAPTNYALIVDNLSIFFKSDEDELQVEDIKTIIEDIKLKPDHRLILLLIGRLSLTATQIVSLNTHQLDFEAKTLNLSDTQKIELPHQIFTLIREYLLDVRPNIIGANENLSFFLNEKGKSFTEIDIYKLIKKLSEDLSLKGKLTTRSLKKLSEKESTNDIMAIQREIYSIISPT